MVDVRDLVKSFTATDGGENRAVDGISFCVDAGEIYGLLGPNGAGKTTTLRMLSGLIPPSGGSATLAGHDVAEDPIGVKRNVGFLTANTGLYQRLTPRELLAYFAALQGLEASKARERIQYLIDWLDMGAFAGLRCGTLSTGQKQRVNIGRALIADPPILIMDEPTLGLDVLTNRIILEFVRRAAGAGKTIILSTHYLDEAESLCHRVGFLHRGRIVAQGDLTSLREQTGRERLSDIFLYLVGREREEQLAELEPEAA